MAAPFMKLPSTATITPSPFHVAIPDEQLSDLKTLLRLSRTAPQTYENLQEDRRYGVTHKWLSTMKEEWLNKFDWYMSLRSVVAWP
jgi:microsomal epoxide hydrolase